MGYEMSVIDDLNDDREVFISKKEYEKLNYENRFGVISIFWFDLIHCL